MRWTCPEPRNLDTGIKYGPCGGETDQFSPNATLVVSPGPFTVQWEESITHEGAPFRISLSSDGRDTDTLFSKSCVLIDHIPHNDETSPSVLLESTYELYSLTINIPDVACERCSLQIFNAMTDKIGGAGSPNGTGCTYPGGTCSSVYHSCTLPIKITGRTPRKDYKCTDKNPLDWPTSWIGDKGVAVPAIERGVYRRESSPWKNGLLLGVPTRYRTIVNTTNSRCLNFDYVDPRQAPASKGFFARILSWLQNLLSFFR
jgi:hypothetical protein